MRPLPEEVRKNGWRKRERRYRKAFVRSLRDHLKALKRKMIELARRVKGDSGTE